MNIRMVFVIILVILNIFSFILFYVDKRRAINHEWRISEKALFLSAIVGGSIGAIAGMYTFHHKTKHWYFVIGMPVILVIQIVIVYALLQKGIL